ncbi:tol-pal system YbgF family protein [Pontiella sp.]|uniref:tetratricopeptide repeat protein n=1 Tax=Pontiella sp. TaxID=2837462 RepID=UPI003564AC1F
MRLTASILVVLALVSSVVAQSEYAAKVTVNNGSSFVVKNLNIKGDRLYAETGSASSSLSMISEIEFRFSGVSLPLCEKLFYTGDRKSLESMLEQYVGPVAQYSYLPTNLGDYLVWMLKAQYWNGNAAGVGKTIGLIRAEKSQSHVDVASLYFVMLLIDQGKTEDAKRVFESVSQPESVSVPMAEYIQGKLALEGGEPRLAMQHVARILAFHSRDAEWLAPATVLEARIYQQLGQPQKAEAVANELMIAYPGTQWSTLGAQIKKESTGNAGG